MTTLKKALSPVVYSCPIVDKLQSTVAAGSCKENGSTSNGTKLPKITVNQAMQTDVLKSLADLEEYLDVAHPSYLLPGDQQHVPASEDSQFWRDIRKKLLEIAELTYQTRHFECCHKEDTVATSRQHQQNNCPFTTSPGVSPHPSPSPPSPAVALLSRSSPLPRRGSSPIPSSLQREFLVSYGGFERMMSTNYHDSDFALEDGNEQVRSENAFRRDLRGAPVRRKKHFPHSSANIDRHSSPNIDETAVYSQFLHVARRYS